MTVYHLNRGIGRASSGIEYAQKYRYDLVKDFPEQQFFVFTVWMGINFIHWTDKMGFAPEHVMNAYKFMAGQENHRSSYTLEDFQKTISPVYKVTEDTGRATVLKFNKTTYKVWYLDGTRVVDRIDTIFDGKLKQVSYYTDRLTDISEYVDGYVVARYFHDEDGRVAMRQYYDSNKEITLTIVGDKVLQGRTAFYQEFFRRLDLKKGDLVVVDRNRETTDALFPITKANGVPVVNAIHAEHFNAARIEDNWIAWNNFYEYPFMNPQYIEYFITATEKQKEVFLDQMSRMNKPTKAVAIPVGSVHRISDGTNVQGNKYKFMTASRLAWEKHIDVLVRAVVKAKAQVPELSFDIYGDGKFRGDLVKLIDELGAGDYITMQGHKNLDEEYDKYGGYLTASGSEGFGLSILEAVAASLPIIGLNVNYGNTEFVKSGVNGILVEKTDEHEQIDTIASAIVEMVNTLDYDAAIAWSKEKASHFTDDVIRQKWRDLYDEFVGNGDNR